MNQIQIPNESACKGIPREEMPQIAADDVQHFLNIHHVAPANHFAETGRLKPTQSNFSVDKILNMDEASKRLPILVSSDDFVLDGHHRWLANHMSRNLQPITRLPWDVDTSIGHMKSFRKSFTKSVHEDAAPVVSIGGGAMDNTVTPKPKKIKSFRTWRRTEK